MLAKLTDGGLPAAEEVIFAVLCVPVDFGAVSCAQVSKGRRKWVVVDTTSRFSHVETPMYSYLFPR
jgi:hypothetical protein